MELLIKDPFPFIRVVYTAVLCVERKVILKVKYRQKNSIEI